MSIIKKPYEISIWEDRFIDSINGIDVSQEFITQEKKIVVIGSNEMTSKSRAIEPKLIKNINGIKTLSFILYDNYYDEIENKKIKNPFIPLLRNETKIKLKLDDKWYDFVIKNIQEDSSNNTHIYTANDLYINELAKNGFDLTFDDKLENNVGTLDDLVPKVLEGTNWIYNKNNTDTIYQYDIKPLQRVTINEGNTITFERIIDGKKYPQIKLIKGVFYVFYLEDKNEEKTINSSKLQCILAKEPGNEISQSGVTLDKINYPVYKIVEDFDLEIGTTGGKAFINKAIEPLYANKLIDAPERGYDPKIDEYYTVVKKKSKQNQTEDKTPYRCYKKPYFVNLTLVLDFLSNNKDFAKARCWQGKTITSPGVLATTFPEMSYNTLNDLNKDSNNKLIPFKSYIKVEPKKAGYYVYNTSITEQRSQIGEISEDKTYYFRIKYYYLGYSKPAPGETKGKPELKPIGIEGTTNFTICNKTIDGADKTPEQFDDEVVAKTEPDPFVKDGYVWYKMKFNRNISKADLLDGRYALRMKFTDNNSHTYYIEEVNLFEEVIKKVGDKEIILVPSDDKMVGDNKTGVVKTNYYVYDPEKQKNKNYNKDSIIYEYIGENVFDYYKYSSNDYKKKRLLRASKSNRFNILQSLGELFDAYPIFNITHYREDQLEEERTEEISLNKKDEKGDTITVKLTHVPGEIDKRYIYYKDFSTSKLHQLGFKKGINLVSENRQIISDNIVTKTIVKQNSNEFAPKGFCTIAGAQENYTKENVIYNFDYYIHQGLISQRKLHQYLYSTQGNKEDGTVTEGLYVTLRSLNIQIQEKIDQATEMSATLNKLEANKKVFKEASENAADLERQARQSMKYTYQIDNPYNLDANDSHWQKQKFLSLATEIKIQNQLATKYEERSMQVKEEYDNTKNAYDVLQEDIKTLIDEKKMYLDVFFQRFGRYIQEGVWSSEDYYDDNLYYLDATQVANTSAFPQVNYTINVIDLSPLEDYKYYNFDIGERTYIEDTDFFGWNIDESGRKTPYKEEVVISEIAMMLDKPETNTITVQNYKTQFQEVFQKVVATTQGLQFKEGNYDKVSNIIESNGDLKIETLQNSFNNNALIIENAKDQTVTWGDNGITVRNLSKANELLRIVSGGIMLSTDGGQTYQAAIRGSGINANYITAGLINASKINILSSTNTPAFRWDEYGINAYSTISKTINLGKFVRFDQYGLYGVNNGNSGETYVPDPIEPQNDIKRNASFGMLWDGFFLKNGQNGTGIEISTQNDFLISQDNHPIIKIGLLTSEINDDKKYYGIRIKDINKNTVLESNDKGELFLRDCLYVGMNNMVTIGLTNEVITLDNIDYNAIINANNNFIVYENGYVKAAEGEFQGKIQANEGLIGSMIINRPESDDDALIIKDRNFSIRDKENNKLLFFNAEPDNTKNEKSLTISGDVEFKGIVNATDGNFNGSITSTTGNIGGFTIGENTLETTGLIIQSASDVSESIIQVDNIELGKGAKIKDYIEIGENNPVYIKNPDYVNDVKILKKDIFIKSGNLTLDNKGIIKLGTDVDHSITIDGSNNSPHIYGPGFDINGNISEFNNVNVSGKIVSAVFEIGRVQSMGGAMIFRPSFDIIDQGPYSEDSGTEPKKLQIVVEDETNILKQGDIIYLVKSKNFTIGSTNGVLDFPIAKIMKIERGAEDTAPISLYLSTFYDSIELDGDNKIKYKNIILIESANQASCLFGINSEGSKYSFLHPQGITLSSGIYDNNSNTCNYHTHLFLGNLEPLNLAKEGLNSDFLQGYGLYCDNVYLNGSLVTRTGDKYAGVSTNPPANKSTSIIYTGIDETDSHGSIVFWAGADSADMSEIDKAPFKVHQDGYCYASNMKINESIFANGTITGAKIIAATIEGNDENGRLNIIDTGDGINNGIYFKQRTNKGEINTISLHSTGFKFYDTTPNGLGHDFIQIKKNNDGKADINFIGKEGIFKNSSSEIIHIDGQGLKYIENNDVIATSIKLDSEKIIVDSSNIEVKGKKTILENDLYIKNNKSYEMNYKPVNGGYDLYIYEIKEE